MNLVKRIPIIALMPFIMSIATSCNRGPQTFYAKITMPSTSGQAFCEIALDITHKDMQNHGYAYGDIIEITAKKDGYPNKTLVVPYVTNFNEAGTYGPCLCDYESVGRKLEVATGFKTAGIKEADYYANGECEIKINKKGGYKKMRDLASVTTKTTFEECNYMPDIYSNSRDVTSVGSIKDKVKDKTLLRGSSPIANSKNNTRYIFADSFLYEKDVKTDISLSLTFDELTTIYKGNEQKGKKAEVAVGPYAKSLFKENESDSKIHTVSLGSDFFRTNDVTPAGGDLTAKVFTTMADSNNAGPFFVHCNEGKDRTGFIIMILEALCDVTLDDLVADYMLTFDNYYKISESANKEKYDAMANLTCYRNLYSFMIEADNGNDRYNKLAEIDMLTFDSKAEVLKLVEEHKSENNYLQKCAIKYLNGIGVKGDLESGPSDTDVYKLHEKFAK